MNPVFAATAFALGAYAAQPRETGADVEPAHDVLARLVATWPSRGAVFAEFRNVKFPDDASLRNEVGFHFESGAWFNIRVDGVNKCNGMTPRGDFYWGRAAPGQFKIEVRPSFDPSGAVDLMFPGFGLRALLVNNVSDLRRCEFTDTSGGRLVFDLPRGSRSQRLDNLPASFIESAGGVDAIMKELTIELSPSLQVVATQIAGEDRVEYSNQANCPGTNFQVSQHCPWPGDNTGLVSCRYDPSAGPELFEIAAVERRAIARRTGVPPKRTPAQTDPSASNTPVGPLGRTTIWSAIPWAVSAAGITLVAVGGLAWLRQRAGRG